MIEYRIITETSPDDLQKRVSTFLQGGWELRGEVTFGYVSGIRGQQNHAVWTQTMTRKRDGAISNKV